MSDFFLASRRLHMEPKAPGVNTGFVCCHLLWQSHCLFLQCVRSLEISSSHSRCIAFSQHHGDQPLEGVSFRVRLWELKFFFYCCAKHDDQKQPEGGKGLFGLYFYIGAHHWGKAGKELRQEPGAGTREEGCLLACSTNFLIQTRPRPICLKMVPPIVSWALLHQLAVKKMPHRHFLPDEGSSSVEVPSFKVYLVCVKLTKTK